MDVLKNVPWGIPQAANGGTGASGAAGRGRGRRRLRVEAHWRVLQDDASLGGTGPATLGLRERRGAAFVLDP